MSLEVRTVTVYLFTHMCMCERDGWTQRNREMDGHREIKRDYLSTVASDGIQQLTCGDQQRERERGRERARDRVKEREGERASESANWHFI